LAALSFGDLVSTRLRARELASLQTVLVLIAFEATGDGQEVILVGLAAAFFFD
jgi:hypothetical protein